MPPFSLLSTVCYGRLVTLGNKPLRANSVTPALPLGGWEHLIMAKNLTTKDVENVKPGTARKEIPDALLPGLYLVVQPSGAKSWAVRRSEEHTSELQSLMRISYAVFCLKKKTRRY